MTTPPPTPWASVFSGVIDLAFRPGTLLETMVYGHRPFSGCHINPAVELRPSGARQVFQGSGCCLTSSPVSAPLIAGGVDQAGRQWAPRF